MLPPFGGIVFLYSYFNQKIQGLGQGQGQARARARATRQAGRQPCKQAAAIKSKQQQTGPRLGQAQGKARARASKHN